MLQTYFESLDGNWETVAGLPVEGIGLDFVRTTENLMLLNRHGFPSNKVLGAGVVNGRNVWRINLEETLSLLDEIAGRSTRPTSGCSPPARCSTCPMTSSSRPG